MRVAQRLYGAVALSALALGPVQALAGDVSVPVRITNTPVPVTVTNPTNTVQVTNTPNVNVPAGVTVNNTAVNPIPVVLDPSSANMGSVTILNTPLPVEGNVTGSVAISNTPTVIVANPTSIPNPLPVSGNVGLSGAVTISGTPTVNVANPTTIPSPLPVSFLDTPLVNVANWPTSLGGGASYWSAMVALQGGDHTAGNYSGSVVFRRGVLLTGGFVSCPWESSQVGIIFQNIPDANAIAAYNSTSVSTGLYFNFKNPAVYSQEFLLPAGLNVPLPQGTIATVTAFTGAHANPGVNACILYVWGSFTP